MPKIEKAVILAAGVGSRFLPLSKVLPKELWPLVDVPIIDYLLQELQLAGIKEVVIVLPPDKNQTLSYLKKNQKLEKFLEKRNKKQALLELRKIQDVQKHLSISTVVQEKPLGDGNALLQAKKKIGKNPFVLLFCDDIIETKVSAISQLLKIFKTSGKPVIALQRIAQEQVSAFGVIEPERIAKRFFKIKSIIEKPSIEKAPSNLIIRGKYVLTPEIFTYLEDTKSIKKTGRIAKKTGEIIIAEALANILQDGKVIYGYEIDGTWLPCGDKISWLKSHLYLSLKHPQFGPELKQYLKEII